MEKFYLLYPKQTLQKGASSLTPLCKAWYFPDGCPSKQGINVSSSLGLCLFYFQKKNTVGKKVTVWNILQPSEQDKISKVWARKNWLTLA